MPCLTQVIKDNASSETIFKYFNSDSVTGRFSRHPQKTAEMEDKHRDILKSCHVALVTDLEPEMLFAHLIQEGIMISDDQEEITKIARRTRRNEEFLSILSRRGPTAYQEFVKALEENQSFLACKLLREGKYFIPLVVDFEKSLFCLVRGA